MIFSQTQHLFNLVHSRIKSNWGTKWCDPNKAYSLDQRLGPNHAQGPIHGQHASQSQCPSRSPITRGMLKKIQLGFIQDGPKPHGLLTLFTWAKEDMNIWRPREKHEKQHFFHKKTLFHTCIHHLAVVHHRWQFPSGTHKCTSKGMCRPAASKACQAISGKFPET